MVKKLLKNKKGISPVIATVIIVAVAIAIAIAVALWATGLVGTFTRYEKLEVSAAWANSTGVYLIANNTGSSTVTVSSVFVNGEPASAFGATVSSPSLPCTISPGNGQLFKITSSNFKSGVTYEITLHTASGKDYPKSVTVP